jgi:CHAT domain-containing protein
VTLFSASGAVLFERELTDTLAAIPDSVPIRAEQSYLWKVEARVGWDRWVSSDFVDFRLLTRPAGTAESLHIRARRLSDAELTEDVRSHPLEVRPALASTLALVAGRASTPAASALATARRLAAAYAAAWHDPFLVRQVDRFEGWPPAKRAAKIVADSLRAAGIAAFGRDGAAKAIVIWRRALAQSALIPDTAGIAATFGNLGAGLLREQHPDSAEVVLQRARALAASVGDLRVEANAITELGGVSEARNDLTGARDHYAAALPLLERIGDSRGLAATYNNLAGVAQSVGDLVEARRGYDAALAINRRDGRSDAAATNLMNLAGLASLEADFARAERLYREALGTWRRLGQWSDVADGLRGFAGLSIRRGDYPSASAALTEALTLYERNGPIADALDVRQALAGLEATRGDLQGAIDHLRRAAVAADSAPVSARLRARIRVAQADLAVRLNRLDDAAELYRTAERLARAAGDPVDEAEAQQGRGMLLAERDDWPAARDLLAAAERTELATGNRRAAALTGLTAGRVSLRAGDTASARRQFARAATDLARLSDPVALALALEARASLEAAAHRPAIAESLYRSALIGVGDRVIPDLTWRLHAGLGGVQRDRGAVDDAARELRAGIADVERTGASLALAERRSGFFSDKWDPFEQLVLLERSRGRVADAFDASERIRAGEMLELLGRGRIAAPRDPDGDLVRREQDLRRQIAELYRGAEASDGRAQSVRGPDVSRIGDVAREALLRAQASYRDLLLEMQERAPRQATLVTRATSSWRDVAARLAPDQALIEYLVADDGVLAFVVVADTVAAIKLPVTRHELARLVDFVRGTLQPRGSPRLDSVWRAPLRQLYRDLILPLESSALLAGKTRLVVVPHAELHYLPFAALIDARGSDRFLVERFQVAVAPSASVWLELGTKAARGSADGVLALAPNPGSLPGSGREVDAIARAAEGRARVAVGPAASEAVFRREASRHRVIHLATFGVLNKQNPLFSYVALAPGAGEDGRLEAHEVFGLRLNADLVVLSACQTALGSGALTDVPPGDDWVGLTRAFLSAGAARVLATLWPVQDRATADLMERFYQRFFAGSDAGSALAAAQRDLLAKPGTASPYYWAGFELVGGR